MYIAHRRKTSTPTVHNHWQCPSTYRSQLSCHQLPVLASNRTVTTHRRYSVRGRSIAGLFLTGAVQGSIIMQMPTHSLPSTTWWGSGQHTLYKHFNWLAPVR